MLYLAGMYELGCNLFFLVWPWELGLSVMSKANPPSYVPTLPSLTPRRSIDTTCFLPFVSRQNFLLLLVSSSQARNILNTFYLEKESTLTSTFSCPFSFSPFMKKLLVYPLFLSSLLHLPFATHVVGWALTHFSKQSPVKKTSPASPSMFSTYQFQLQL